MSRCRTHATCQWRAGAKIRSLFAPIHFAANRRLWPVDCGVHCRAVFFFNFYVPCDCLSFERGRSSTPICRPELSRFSASWYRSTDQPRDCVTGSASMLLSNWDGCCYSNGNLRTQILRKRRRAIINFLWILSSVERRILFNHGATPGVMCFLVFSFVFPLKFCGKLFQFKQ